MTELLREQVGTYRARRARDAPRAGVSLGGDIFLAFAIAPEPSLLTLSTGLAPDPLLLEALIGPEARDLVVASEYRIELPDPAPEGLLLAWQLALVQAVRRAPVLRSTRPRLVAMTTVLAHALDQLGFDCEPLVLGGMRQLPGLLGPAGPVTARAVGRDLLLAAAVRTGWHLLDPFEEPWPWFDALYDATVGVGCPAAAALGVASAATARGQGTVVPLAGSVGRRRDDGPGRRFSLVWDLIDEALLPEDAGFDEAVELVAGHDRALIRVACRPAGAPNLYARLIAPDGRLQGVTALGAGEECWEGVVPLPPGFVVDDHRVEIVDHLSRPVRPADANPLCRQWALLAAAQDLCGGDGSEAWGRSRIGFRSSAPERGRSSASCGSSTRVSGSQGMIADSYIVRLASQGMLRHGTVPIR